MIEILSDIYAVVMTLLVITMVIGCLVLWGMMLIDKRQEESFDEKYRRTRKHDGYKSGR
jgi:hypothetical protein